jgi:hypothetical protein
MKKKSLHEVLKLGIELTKEIVAEILCSHCDLFEEVTFQDKTHKITLLKKFVFSFISIKGKHLCKTVNSEQNSLIRHLKTKQVLFQHE